jgi:peptide deformylase
MAIILPKQIGAQDGQFLFEESKAIDNFEEAKEIVQSLRETLDHYGGVGLAAPQIGIQKRIFIVDIKPNERRPNIKEIGFVAYINPKIIKMSAKKNSNTEGCLSVIYGSLFGKVRRSDSLKIEYFDAAGKKHLEEIKDLFHSRVIQHEFDHLQGTIFLQRIKPKDFSALFWDEELDIRKKD